jgi:hypothetical protein
MGYFWLCWQPRSDSNFQPIWQEELRRKWCFNQIVIIILSSFFLIAVKEGPTIASIDALQGGVSEERVISEHKQMGDMKASQ